MVPSGGPRTAVARRPLVRGASVAGLEVELGAGDLGVEGGEIARRGMPGGVRFLVRPPSPDKI